MTLIKLWLCCSMTAVSANERGVRDTGLMSQPSPMHVRKDHTCITRVVTYQAHMGLGIHASTFL